MLTADLVILVLAILNGSHVHGGLVGEDQATRDKVGVTGVKNSIQHALVQEEVTHPFRDDDIHLRERKLNLLHLALEESDPIGQTVHGDDLLGLLDD